LQIALKKIKKELITLLSLFLKGIFLLSHSFTLYAQPLNFILLSEKEGFPPSTVNTIIQDKIGFIWIGTTDGLFRYDGQTFEEFRHNPLDSTTLSNNYIKSLGESKNGDILVGTKYGLNIFNKKSQQFQQHINKGSPQYLSNENQIHSVIEDRHGHIWYGTHHGLFRWSISNDSLLHFLPDSENQSSISNSTVWTVFEDSKGRIWAVTQNGLNVYDNNSGFQFTKFLPDPIQPFQIQAIRTWTFIEQPNGTLWMGSDHGIYRLDENQGKIRFINYKHDPENENSLSHNFIQVLYADGENRIWVGTWAGGLNELLVNDNIEIPPTFIRHKKDENNEQSINSNTVNDVIKDKSGILWIATSGGLSKVSPNTDKFIKVGADSKDLTSLSGTVIRGLLKDKWGGLWVATMNGLNYLSPENLANQTFKFQSFEVGLKQKGKMTHERIHGLWEDPRGYLWIATYLGLNFLNLNDFYENKEPYFRFFGDLNGLPHTFIQCVYGKGNDIIWVGTIGGLCKMEFDTLNSKNTRFTNYGKSEKKGEIMLSGNILSINADRFGSIWVGTINGLAKYVESGGDGHFEKYIYDQNNPSSISGNTINDLHLDQKGRMWAATRSGINLLQQNEKNGLITFKNFGIKHGFENDVIQSIEEDNEGRLWLGTNRGLIHFDQEAALSNQPCIIRTYKEQDGLIGTFQVRSAAFSDSSGHLYFGSANGLSIFDPIHIPQNEILPNIVFRNIKINNQPVPICKDCILNQSIETTKKLFLPHQQNDIELEFAALEFTNPSSNQYIFKMEGYDNEWVENGNSNTARYTNLPTGHFTFLVKGSNNDGLWCKTALGLEIEVLPPPWKTWWAYLLYLILGGSFLYFIYRFRLHQKLRLLKEQARVEKARYEEREQLRKQNAADFHDELGHRLTKISLFLELANRQKNDAQALSSHLSKIKKHTAGLSNGVRDLIWTLDPTSDTLYQTLIRLSEFGDNLFERSGIKFHADLIDKELSNINLQPPIRKHLLMIFKEAMNNCLKYSEAERCVFSIHQKSSELILELTDNGKGFDPDTEKKGYGLNNMSERAKKLNGKLSIKSKKSMGTTITLIFNIPHLG